MKQKASDQQVLSDAAIQRLEAYRDLLTRWNGRINLVASRDVPHLWDRHIIDSLQLRPLMEGTDGGPAIDLGSGAGFPGLVLAIVTDRPFHLVDSDRRKCLFLREVARVTHADVTVHHARIETLSLPPSRLITARALAPLPLLLEWAAPLLAPEGRCLFLKGRHHADELTAAARQWHMRVKQVASRTDPAAAILIISEVRRVEPHLRT